MTARDKLVLKLVRCLGPISVPSLVRRVRRMFPVLAEDGVATEVCQALAAAMACHYVDCWKVGEIYVYDVTTLGRNWFDREYGNG